jgi:hypothetical protein
MRDLCVLTSEVIVDTTVGPTQFRVDGLRQSATGLDGPELSLSRPRAREVPRVPRVRERVRHHGGWRCMEWQGTTSNRGHWGADWPTSNWALVRTGGSGGALA